jgi:hypothetical protein
MINIHTKSNALILTRQDTTRANLNALSANLPTLVDYKLHTPTENPERPQYQHWH